MAYTVSYAGVACKSREMLCALHLHVLSSSQEASFIFLGPKLWNKLPENVAICVTLPVFKASGGTRFFWGEGHWRGKMCFSEGAKIQKISENGWYLHFFFDGGKVGRASDWGKCPLMPPWCCYCSRLPSRLSYHGLVVSCVILFVFLF